MLTVTPLPWGFQDQSLRHELERTLLSNPAVAAVSNAVWQDEPAECATDYDDKVALSSRERWASVQRHVYVQDIHMKALLHLC